MALPVRRVPAGARVWDPFREFDQMRRVMAGALDADAALHPSAGWVPAVDVEETDGAYILEAEVPGVRREDITIDLDGQDLTVKGGLAEREHEGVVHRRARRSGSFAYRVSLPHEVDEEGVSASLTDGVLRIELPKAGEAKPRRIEIAA